MGARPLTPLGRQLLAALPPFLRTSPDYESVAHASSREFARLEATIEQVRAQFNPQHADLLLSAWETIVRLPVGGRGAAIDQRQHKIVVRLRKLLGASEGREWEESITEVVGSGWTYEEHIPGDITSPPVNTIRIALPFAPSGDLYLEALREIRELTPAHLDISFSSGAGFLVDESHLDLEGLGV